MKILFLGDTHFGNHRQFGGPIVAGINRRCQELLDAVEREVRRVQQLHPDLGAVVQVGDFFDQARPSAAIVDASIRMMKGFPDLEWHILKGNHDMATFDAPSAVAPLGHVPGIRVYEQPKLVRIGSMKFGMIPYIDHSASVAMHQSKHVLSQADTLVMHYGVVREPTRPDQIGVDQVNGIWKQYAVSMTSPHRYGNIISGHEHGERSAGEYDMAIGLGSFADLDWSATRFSWPTLLILDSESGALDHLEIEGPAFVGWGPKTFNDKQILCMAINSHGAGIYIECPEEKEAYLRALVNIGLVQGYRVKPPQEIEESIGGTTERGGFSDLEQPIAEVLDSQGADLADEATQRVWASCIQHMKEH